MSYVEVLILRRLLHGGPAHGYELRKSVESSTGVVLNNNALYPALRRFEEAGAVTKASEQQPGRPARLVYTLTDIGRELLQDLLADLSPEQAADDGEFLSRVATFAMLPVADRLRVLDAREEAVRRHGEMLRGLAVRTAGRDWADLVTSEMIRRCTAEIDWLATLRAMAQQLPLRPEGE
jgi:DNA-binding PadR family transcriptional regulator